MSKLIADTFRHTGGSADNITLDGSQNVTVEGNLTVDGTTTLTGELEITSHLEMGDGDVIKLGDSDDLQIYHNGTASYFDEVGTGGVVFSTDSFTVRDITSNESMIVATGDGSVELYYDNAKKLETKSSGVIISNQGNNRVLDVKHTDGDNAYIAFIDQNTTGGSNSKVRLGCSGMEMTIFSGGGEVLRLTSNQDVNIPTDGKKLQLGASQDLQIHHTSGVNHIRSDNGDLVIGTQNNHTTILGQYYGAAGGGDTLEIWGGSNVVPATNDAVDLGETNHKWDDIYATNSSIQTSDQNTKDNITASDLGLPFINKLSPKSYKFKGKTRTHYGLIAQDIETVLGDISKPTADFAGFIKTPAPEQLYTERDEAHNRIPSGKAIGDVKLAAHTDYGLRYTEFIGPLVKAVQELSAEVETLKTKVAALEAG